MDCVNPSPDNRCECYPFGVSPFFGPSLPPTGTCALRFLTESHGSVIGLPALDGSDSVKTSECLALEAQPDSLGERCAISHRTHERRRERQAGYVRTQPVLRRSWWPEPQVRSILPHPG